MTRAAAILAAVLLAIGLTAFIAPQQAHADTSGTWHGVSYDMDDAGNVTFHAGTMTGDFPADSSGSSWDLENATSVRADGTVVLPADCSKMFYALYAPSLASIDMANFDSSNVANMSDMFAWCSGLQSIDLSGLDTSNVTDMSGMFLACIGLKSLNLSGFDTSGVADTSKMFCVCESLESLDLSPLETSNVTDMSGMFSYCKALTFLDLSPLDTSNVTDMSGMFYDCVSLESLDLSPLETSNVTDMSDMFTNCRSFTSLDLSPLETSNVTDMSDMFNNCVSLVYLDLSPLDTSNVTDMSGMFCACESLKPLNLSPLETSNVTDMSHMFTCCWSFTSLDLSPLETSNVTDMSGMFSYCKALTFLDLSPLDTSSVTDMGNMFELCKSITFLDLSPLDTSSVTDMKAMFSSCDSLKSLDLSPLDTSNVTDMSGMFDYCKALTFLDLSPLDTSQVKYMSNMFDGCPSLSTVKLGEGFSFCGAGSERLCSLPDGTWLSSADGKTYAADEIPNNIAATYTLNGAANQSDSSSDLFTEELSGVIREGDGWAMRWTCSYTVNSSGAKTKPKLAIYMDGSDSGDNWKFSVPDDSEDTSPWLAATGFGKEDFVSVSIEGTEQNPIYIASRQFAGYTKVQTASFSHIYGFGDGAFEGCTNLKTATGLDTSLASIGAEAFADTQLTSLDIYGSDTAIGDDAFRGCDALTLTVDGMSSAEEYAVENGIAYVVRDLAVEFEGHTARFNPSMFAKPATESNKDMALLSGILSWAEYNISSKSMIDVYHELGISDDDIYERKGGDVSLCFSIGERQMRVDGEDTNLLIVSMRGTQTANETYRDKTTSSNKDFYGYPAYDVIYDFEEEAFEQIDKFVDTHPELEQRPLKLLITGHSLGGAGANLLGARFTRFADGGAWWSDLLDKDDIFVYTFGAIDAMKTDGTVSDGYENIHNITNFHDTFGPSGWPPLFRAAGDSRYGKFGHIDLFDLDYGLDLKGEDDDLLDFGEWNTRNHDIGTYVGAVDDGIVSYEDASAQRIASFHCPVDVEVYRDGALVGRVTGNAVDEDVTTIPIAVEDDEKYVLLPDDASYTFKVTATDAGTMEYDVADAATGAVQKTFSNVALEDGKVLSAEVGGDVTAGDERLFVVDDAGERLAEVATDGSEASPAAAIDISGATVTLAKASSAYTGKAQAGSVKSVTLNGTTLKAGTDYTVSAASGTKPGSYTVTVTGKGNYTGTATAKFTIAKAANPLSVKAKTAKVKYSKVKKKAQTLKASKVLKVSKAKGKVTYKLTSVKKGSKSFKSKFKVNAKTGKVTVKKGTKKGTYKVKVKVRAAGSAYYKAKTVTKTFTVKVK